MQGSRELWEITDRFLRNTLQVRWEHPLSIKYSSKNRKWKRKKKNLPSPSFFSSSNTEIRQNKIKKRSFKEMETMCARVILGTIKTICNQQRGTSQVTHALMAGRWENMNWPKSVSDTDRTRGRLLKYSDATCWRSLFSETVCFLSVNVTCWMLGRRESTASRTPRQRKKKGWEWKNVEGTQQATANSSKCQHVNTRNYLSPLWLTQHLRIEPTIDQYPLARGLLVNGDLRMPNSKRAVYFRASRLLVPVNVI